MKCIFLFKFSSTNQLNYNKAFWLFSKIWTSALFLEFINKIKVLRFLLTRCRHIMTTWMSRARHVFKAL